MCLRGVPWTPYLHNHPPTYTHTPNCSHLHCHLSSIAGAVNWRCHALPTSGPSGEEALTLSAAEPFEDSGGWSYLRNVQYKGWMKHLKHGKRG